MAAPAAGNALAVRALPRLGAPARLALLLALYLALAALPLALASLQSLPRRPWPDELASGLGMTALAVLLMEFLLSGRYRALSAGVGMDLTMRFHQMMAIAAKAATSPALSGACRSPARRTSTDPMGTSHSRAAAAGGLR